MEKEKNKKSWVKYFLWGCVAGIIGVIIFKYIELIVSYCNSNQGFFSALLGFLAILISVLTYYNQKKEQTNNAQDNARLQRELTEQHNKLQADLQLRQIKLEKYNLLITNWRNLYKLKDLIAVLIISPKVDFESEEELTIDKFNTLEKFYYFYKNISYDDEKELFLYNILSNINELNFLFDKDKFQQLGQIRELIYKFYMRIKSFHYFAKNDFSHLTDEDKEDFLNKIIDTLKSLYDNINVILIELEHEINEYDLKNIQNIERK